MYNQSDLAKKLLNMRKINPNLFIPNTGFSPLMTAISHRNSEIAKLIIFDRFNITNKNELDLTDSISQTYLHMLAKSSNQSIFKEFLERKLIECRKRNSSDDFNETLSKIEH